ncbi:hypothetical protein D8M35_05475 [Curtobacterium sp. HSID17257]|nr:hypothetical protein D8M35_05475 [Curtobacterium sp. HSID17257]
MNPFVVVPVHRSSTRPFAPLSEYRTCTGTSVALPSRFTKAVNVILEPSACVIAAAYVPSATGSRLAACTYRVSEFITIDAERAFWSERVLVDPARRVAVKNPPTATRITIEMLIATMSSMRPTPSSSRRSLPSIRVTRSVHEGRG